MGGVRMKPYDEALRIWAADRFGVDLDKIDSVELEEVPQGEGFAYSEVTFESGEPAHLKVTIRSNDWSSSTSFKVDAPLAAVIYEVVHAGMKED
jgi:hypothetical protein